MSLQQVSNVSLSNNGLKGIGYKHYALAIVAFSAIVRFISLTDRYFWCDEASSVLTSRYDVGALLYHASFDVHPPLYYLLLHGWMVLFGDGIMAARALSLVFGVITVALAMRFTRWLANERAALTAGWLMAIMPMAVRYSQEARMYALMGLLAIAAAMALAKWLKTPDNRRYLALYALLMTLSFYTHYFTIFTLIAHWLVVLALSCRREGECYIRLPAWWGPMRRLEWPIFPGCWCCSICWRILPNCGSAATSVGSLRLPGAICRRCIGVFSPGMMAATIPRSFSGCCRRCLSPYVHCCCGGARCRENMRCCCSAAC